MSSQVAEVRRFSRTVTQRVGALNDRFASRDRPLAVSRLLWEIGTEGGEVVTLRSRLGVDSGQMSRMLRALEADELIRVTPSDVDRRIRVARPTEKGLAERAILNERSDELVASILEPLSGAQQDELVAAMRTVERLITTSLVELRQVDPEMPDAQRCLRAYVAELNRRAPQRGFDPGKGATAKSHEVRPPNGAFVIADLRGEAIGCGAVKHQPGNVTDIKRMWLAESARDLGSVAASLSTSSTSRANTVRAKRTSKPATCCQKRSRSTGRRGTSRYRHSNDEPFADRWFAKSLG